jgi:outer membrane lipoprotein LolB
MATKANNQALTIYYNWQQIDSTHYIIHLFGPLGIGAVTITGKPNQVTLIDSKNQSFAAKNPESLIENALGFQIPVSNLYYWIRGLPSPGKTAKTKRDSFNHLIQTSQPGWNVQFPQYTGIGKIDLPCQLIIKSKALFAKIIISEWQI